MIDATASLQVAEQISAATLIKYLRATGWSSRASRVEGIAIFSKRVSGADNPLQFILPVESTFPDEQRRVADALRTIAQIEGCSEAEIANKAQQTISSPASKNKLSNVSSRLEVDEVESLGKRNAVFLVSGKRANSTANNDIESRAQHLRASLGLADESVFNIVELLEKELPKAIKDFRLEVLPRSQEQEIYSTTVPLRMFVTEHIYNLARQGDARSRFMVAHELGHLLLHHKSVQLRASGRSKTAESEASKFALAFLIPLSIARGFNDPNLLSLYCKVDRKVAEMRMLSVKANNDGGTEANHIKARLRSTRDEQDSN
jgi:Zn-dependent peptidase ImmA (M78 family)